MRHREFWITGEVITNRDSSGKFIEGHRYRDEKIKIKISKSLNGHIPWNRGTPCREETKRRLSKVFKGKHRSLSTEFKRGCVSFNKGIKLSEEVKRKISNTLKGNIPWNKGKKLSREHKENMSKALCEHYKNNRVKDND